MKGKSEMDERLKMYLKKLAARECWSDHNNFMVNDYAGGNIDDAYSRGQDDGETLLARRLIDMIDSA